MKYIIFLLLCAFILVSCRPYSKETYLRDYEKFINKISIEEQSFSENDWKSIELKFNNFNSVWYEDYSSELTIAERLKVTKLHGQYLYYRSKAELKGLLK
jgi:hypothetical protein